MPETNTDTAAQPTPKVIPRGMKQVTVTEYLLNIQPSSDSTATEQLFGGEHGNVLIKFGQDVWAPAWVKEHLDLAVETELQTDPADLNKRTVVSRRRFPYSMLDTRKVTKLVKASAASALAAEPATATE